MPIHAATLDRSLVAGCPMQMKAAARVSVATSILDSRATAAEDARYKLERSARRMRAAEVRSYAHQSRAMAWTVDNLYFYILEQSWTVRRGRFPPFHAREWLLDPFRVVVDELACMDVNRCKIQLMPHGREPHGDSQQHTS
eukprot:scaffold339_cov402-Prasinococcus_capsulatus_cf.AAC.19